ncbi:hypothetical protein ACRAWF_41330 [Streptomyces sp. L7]
MTTTKTHLTGGLGAHHDEEDFGDPYELPNERAYCEDLRRHRVGPVELADGPAHR